MQRKVLTKILSSLSVLVLTACTQVGLGIANLPVQFSDVEIKTDIAYGDKDIQKLDLYIPEISDKDLPVLVFFYGGRWTDGSKDMYDFVGGAFAKKGYVVAIADYSKYPDVKFPTFVEDGAEAVAWVHDNIAQHKGDASKIFVSGHSSGAHIGALVATDERYLKALGKKNIITAFAGLSGPYDFVPQAEDLKDMFGATEAEYSKTMVTSYIDGNEPPMLLLWGEKDQAVWARNHELLSKKIKDKGGAVEVKTYPELNHVETVGSLTWFWRKKAPILEDVDTFFTKYK